MIEHRNDRAKRHKKENTIYNINSILVSYFTTKNMKNDDLIYLKNFIKKDFSYLKLSSTEVEDIMNNDNKLIYTITYKFIHMKIINSKIDLLQNLCLILKTTEEFIDSAIFTFITGQNSKLCKNNKPTIFTKYDEGFLYCCTGKNGTCECRENIKEKIQCKICDLYFDSISHSHLKTHNITQKEYIKKYNINSTICKKTSDNLSKRSTLINKKNKGKKRSDAICKNIQSGIQKTFDEGRSIHNKIFNTSEESNEYIKICNRIKNNKKIIPSRFLDNTKKNAILIKKYIDNVRIILKRLDNIKNFKNDNFKSYIKKLNNIVNFQNKVLYFENLHDGKIINIDKNKKTFKFRCFKCDTISNYSLQYINDSKVNYVNCICNRKSGSSDEELSIVEYIKSLGIKNIILNSYDIIPPLEIDIYLPDYNIAIEYNGLYWHSEKSSGKNKLYHKFKTDKCKTKNIRLIHIFSDEWEYKKDIVKNKIKSLLLKNKKIYARKCIIKEINSNQAKDFYYKNHIQGGVNSKINIGLFYNNKIVACMSFSKPNITKKNKNYEWELTRYCTENSIVGGASKIFSYFLKVYSPISIVSYCDLRYGNGKMYEKLNFVHIGTTFPNYFYVEKYKNRLHRYNFAKHKLVEQGHDPNKTEWEIMQELGYDRIWDCGHLKLEWKKPS